MKIVEQDPLVLPDLEMAFFRFEDPGRGSDDDESVDESVTVSQLPSLNIW
jgi:hypothetical protein